MSALILECGWIISQRQYGKYLYSILWTIFLSPSIWCCCWEEGEYLETNDHNQLLRSALTGVGSFKVPFPQKGVRKMKQPEKEAGFQRKVICFYSNMSDLRLSWGVGRETSWRWLEAGRWKLGKKTKGRAWIPESCSRVSGSRERVWAWQEG